MTINIKALKAALWDAWPVWAGLGSAFLVPWLISHTCASKRDVFLYSGMVFELGGLYLVAMGLSDMRRLFGRPPVKAVVSGWFGRVADAFKPSNTVIVAVAESGSATAFAEVRATNNTEEEASLEQRLDALELNVKRIQAELDSKVQGLRQKIDTATESIGQESRVRQTGDQEITRKLEEIAVGGIHLEALGLFWVCMGLIETNIPEIISEWFF